MRSKPMILVALLLAAFLVNLDTTLVNVPARRWPPWCGRATAGRRELSASAVSGRRGRRWRRGRAASRQDRTRCRDAPRDHARPRRRARGDVRVPETAASSTPLRPRRLRRAPFHLGASPQASPPVPRRDRTGGSARKIAAEIAELGLCPPGTLVGRSTRCGTPTCRCHTDPDQLHGPYPSWIRKAGTRPSPAPSAVSNASATSRCSTTPAGCGSWSTSWRPSPWKYLTTPTETTNADRHDHGDDALEIT
jgi:hypothetical protein